MNERMTGLRPERLGANVFQPEANPMIAENFGDFSEPGGVLLEISEVSQFIVKWFQPSADPGCACFLECCGLLWQGFHSGTKLLLVGSEIDRKSGGAPDEVFLGKFADEFLSLCRIEFGEKIRIGLEGLESVFVSQGDDASSVRLDPDGTWGQVHGKLGFASLGKCLGQGSDPSGEAGG